MIVAMHQPDLLPYSGFWYKMAKRDVSILRMHEQLLEAGYQRRVKMCDKRLTLQVTNCTASCPSWEPRSTAPLSSFGVRGYQGPSDARDQHADLGRSWRRMFQVGRDRQQHAQLPPAMDSYLSGVGGKAYMGDCEEFTEAGFGVLWSERVATTGDTASSRC